jgi:hypothetical protein
MISNNFFTEIRNRIKWKDTTISSDPNLKSAIDSWLRKWWLSFLNSKISLGISSEDLVKYEKWELSVEKFYNDRKFLRVLNQAMKWTLNFMNQAELNNISTSSEHLTKQEVFVSNKYWKL